jgi:hypothetical protein
MAWSKTYLSATIFFRIWPPFLRWDLLNLLLLQTKDSKTLKIFLGQIAYNILLLVVFLPFSTGTI